jgi:hypothetical protein
MKRTIWRPGVLGVIFGLLAGITSVTGFLFIVPGTDSDNAVGFYMILLLLAAALGGPLAGAIASTLLITLSSFSGSPDQQAIMSDPVVFWTNMLVVGTLVALVGLAYRLIFERTKMPVRLLLWAGIVIVMYIINSPANLVLQYYLYGEVGVLPAILGAYRVYVPQAIFDIVFTSLVFIALPSSYTRPLWYEPAKALEQTDKVLDGMTRPKR